MFCSNRWIYTVRIGDSIKRIKGLLLLLLLFLASVQDVFSFCCL